MQGNLRNLTAGDEIALQTGGRRVWAPEMPDGKPGEGVQRASCHTACRIQRPRRNAVGIYVRLARLSECRGRSGDVRARTENVHRDVRRTRGAAGQASPSEERHRLVARDPSTRFVTSAGTRRSAPNPFSYPHGPVLRAGFVEPLVELADASHATNGLIAAA